MAPARLSASTRNLMGCPFHSAVEGRLARPYQGAASGARRALDRTSEGRYSVALEDGGVSRGGRRGFRRFGSDPSPRR